MSRIQTVIFVLCGALMNRTILLGSHFQFIDGKLELAGDEKELAKIAHALAINWQAFPEGDPRIQEVNDEFNKVHPNTGQDIPELQTDNQLNGQGLDSKETGELKGDNNPAPGQVAGLPDGDGQQTELNEKLKTAILGVDPDKDDLWTATGQPAMKAVEALYGSAGITRADVEEAMPGYNRDAALKAKADAAG